MDPTQQFVTDLENTSTEEVRTNFFDLFSQALAIEVGEGQTQESSSASHPEPASPA